MVKQFLVQWTPKHIKTTIIHKLGGYTYKDIKEERNIDLQNAYNLGVNDGQHKAIITLYNKICSLYGLSKQEWIDKVWYIITHAHFVNHTKNIIDENIKYKRMY